MIRCVSVSSSIIANVRPTFVSAKVLFPLEPKSFSVFNTVRFAWNILWVPVIFFNSCYSAKIKHLIPSDRCHSYGHVYTIPICLHQAPNNVYKLLMQNWVSWNSITPLNPIYIELTLLVVCRGIQWRNWYEPRAAKPLARIIQICCVYILCLIFDLFFQNNFPNNSGTKIYLAESDSPRRILLFRGLGSFWGALGRSGIIFIF